MYDHTAEQTQITLVLGELSGFVLDKKAIICSVGMSHKSLIWFKKKNYNNCSAVILDSGAYSKWNLMVCWFLFMLLQQIKLCI